MTRAQLEANRTPKGSYLKEAVLEWWKSLRDDADPLAVMEPIPYKAEGSSYGACGVRIDGSPEFVEAVLARLKPLIRGEGPDTRLELSLAKVKPKTIAGETKRFAKSARAAEVCYIRLHERGNESRIMHHVFGTFEGRKEAADDGPGLFE